MQFRTYNPLLGCMGGLCGGPGSTGYLKTLAPSDAAYYPITKSILEGWFTSPNGSMMGSPVAKVLCGIALVTGGYYLGKAMYEPARKTNPRKKKKKK